MAEIQAPFGLNHTTTDAADLRTLKANLAARDAIPATSRHEGLTCYVLSEQRRYRLQGGIANSNWVRDGFTSGLNEYLFTNDLEFGANGLTGATAPVINDSVINTPVGNYMGFVYSLSGTAIGTTIIRPTTGGVVPYTIRVDKCIVEILTRIQFQALPTAEDFTLNTGISLGAAAGTDIGATIRLVRSGGVAIFQTYSRNAGITSLPFTLAPVVNTWYDCKITLNPITSIITFTISNGTTTETIEHTTNYPPASTVGSPAGTYQWALTSCNLTTTRATTFRTFIDFYGIRLIFTTPRSPIII